MFFPPGAVEGDPFWDNIRDQLLGEPSNETKACHQPKPVLFSTGEVRTEQHVCSEPAILGGILHFIFQSYVILKFFVFNFSLTDIHFF